MTALRSVLECLAVVLFQTAILDLLPYADYFFNPAIPYVIYLALTRPAGWAFFGSAVLGMLLDGISGGPFGAHMTAYLWMVATLRRMTAVIHVNQHWIIGLFSGAGVVFETLVLLGATLMVYPRFSVPATALKQLGVQVLLSIFLGPLLFSFLKRFQPHRDAASNGQNSGHRTQRWLISSKA